MQAVYSGFLVPKNVNIYFNKSVSCSRNFGFVKSDTVSFGSNQDLLGKSGDEILRLVISSVNKPENLIGKGGEASVYRLEGTGYCVRVSHNVLKPEYKSDYRLNLSPSPQEKVNHVVAKLGEDITIMPFFKGYNFFSKNTDKKAVAQMIDQMPQVAFDRLFKQLFNAQKLNMRFDSAWPNVLVNPENSTITAIDFYNNKIHGGLISGMHSALFYKGVTSEIQEKNLNKKILTSFIHNVEQGCSPQIRLFEINTIIEMVKDPKFGNLLGKFFYELSEIIDQKLFGRNVETQLQGKLKVLRTLINQLF